MVTGNRHRFLIFIVVLMWTGIAVGENLHSGGVGSNGRGVFPDGSSAGLLPTSACDVIRPGLVSPDPLLVKPPSTDEAPRSRDKLWFCKAIPVVIDEGPCFAGWNDVRPNSKDEREYEFTKEHDSEKPFPKSAVFLKDKETGKTGYIVPQDALKNVTRLVFKVNGRYTYELEDPFSKKAGLSSTLLWWPGELTDFRKEAIVELLKKENLDTSRIEKIELVGLLAKPLSFSK